MERLAVSSSNLASVGYDNTALTLEVEFNNGGVYQYYNITEDVYTDLMNAGSIGSYFSNNIRNVYPTQKV
ncbi:KTSC domain-containing protein [Buttiauxella sp. S04-F03]|uniref:KTSC domain-containing protein n=1 Tax=Buttiauxella sp. W03-F01 TaxID=2904524 RepID=UPI001E35C275|nr:KTSC domain-containing protein [Buttiauxella sp. W03-F01]MCE0802404.1 KTSC domain-containing protein [Buttiauxella sp. W03-F01]